MNKSLTRIVIVLFYLLIATAAASAQTILSGTVRDAESHEPVSFVNIGILNTGSGTVSDENGRYRLELKSPADSVNFSAIGYHGERRAATDLRADGNVTLRSREYITPMVVIRAKRLSQDFLLGNRFDERQQSIGFGSTQLGTAIGIYLPIERETWLKSAHFTVDHANGDSLLFRVNIYDCIDGKVGENLLRENVLLVGGLSTGLLSVDLQPYKLLVQRDVLLELEFVKAYTPSLDEIGISFRMHPRGGRKQAYFKATSFTPYTRLDMRLGFYVMGNVAE